MSLTKIGSIGINTGIQLAGVTTVSTLKVGTGVTLSSDGDIFATGVTTATSFVGDGSGLTGVASTENIRTNTNATFLQNINVSGSTTTGSLVSSGAISGTTGTFTGNVAVSGANITLQDSGSASDDRLLLGASSDLELYHDGTNSIIHNKTGQTWIQGSELYLSSNHADGQEKYLKGVANGAVELYYNNSLTFTTLSGGNKFVGYLFGTDNAKIYLGASNDLEIYHDGSNSYFLNSTGFLNLKTTGGGAHYIDADDQYFRTSGGENLVKMIGDGAVELYYDNSKKFNTTSTGTNIVGHLVINETGGTAGKGEIAFGESGRPFIEAFDNGNHGSGAGIDFRSGSGDYFLKMNQDAAVQIYYDNVEQMRTHPNGIFTRGIYPLSDNSFSIGSGSQRYTTIYATNSSINTSDRTEKNTIIESDLGLDFVNKLKPVSYKWNEDDGKTHYGLIAQDVEETLTDIGKTVSDFGGIHKEDDSPMGLGYSELISPLIKAVQELSAKNDALASEIEQLKSQLNN